jgi:hypothetical protein
MSSEADSTFQMESRRRAWAHLALGALIGVLAAVVGAVGSANFPHRAWTWTTIYLALALLLSPSSVGLLWITRRAGRWRLVTSERDLSNAQRGFFLGLSGALVLDALAFFVVWGIAALGFA